MEGKENMRFTELLSPVAQQIYRTSISSNLEKVYVKEGSPEPHWISMVRLSVEIEPLEKGAELRHEDMRKLADHFNTAVERGLVGYGVLHSVLYCHSVKNQKSYLLLHTFGEGLDADETFQMVYPEACAVKDMQ